MSPAAGGATPDDTIQRVSLALNLACSRLPHLSGIARTIEIRPDDRVPTAGITAGGRLLVNGDWFQSLAHDDGVFVIAHELMHLCLRSHDRGMEVDHETFNAAHDYVINDMLMEDLLQVVPAGGLWHPGARDMSAEQLVAMLRRGDLSMPKAVATPRTDLGAALAAAGVTSPTGTEGRGPGSGDVIDDDQERRLFPDDTEAHRAAARARVRTAVENADALGTSSQVIYAACMGGLSSGLGEQRVEPLEGCYAPPWEAALVHWMESTMPGRRSFARPSRRQASCGDAVLAGRLRHGWAIHVILDTSISMQFAIQKVLGEIATFCESAQVAAVHILQCDTRVTVDEWIAPDELRAYRILGLGGSDLRPAMKRLRRDPAVEAAIIITDGMIDYLKRPPPYSVLWALTDEPPEWCRFRPRYGTKIRIE